MEKTTTRWKNKKVSVPSILQMEAVECGAACLAMVLAHYGKFVSLEHMRVECGVNRDGSKASNMVKAARKHGLEAKGYRKEPQDLKAYPLPMILFWNFNHFVVLTGIKGNRVYINDPGSGPRVVTWEEFDQAFTGIVLVFSPGSEFTKGGRKPSVISALKNRLHGTQIALLYAVLAGLCLVIPGLITPVFSRVFLDNVLIRGRTDWIIPLLWAMGLTFCLAGTLTWLQQHFLLRLELKLALTSSARFFYHVFRLPANFFFQRQTGEIGHRVQLNDKVAMLLSGDLANNILNLLTIVFYAAIMFQYSVTLTVVGVSIALINFIALRYVSKKRVLLNQKLRQKQDLRGWPHALRRQRSLQNTHVLIIGVGCFGSHVLYGLSAAGIGKITLVDFDVVERSNLNRQCMYSEGDIGRTKIEALQARTTSLNSSTEYECVEKRVESLADCVHLLARHAPDLAVLTADSPRDKIFSWMNEASYQTGVPALFTIGVTPSSVRIGPLVVPGKTACYECSMPDIRFRYDDPLVRCINTRHTQGVIAPHAMMAGGIMTLEILKHVTGFAPCQLYSQRIILDVFRYETHVQTIKSRRHCPFCGKADNNRVIQMMLSNS